jgi:Flp pilus assembly protein TadG
MTEWKRKRRPERGSVSVEIAILAPVLILLFGLAVVAGRQAIAQNAVQAAAHDAARAASISRTADQAQADGGTAVESQLAQQGLNCEPAATVTLRGTSAVASSGNWNLDQAFEQPVGDPVFIIADITCMVSYDDVSMPGIPPQIEVTARFVSPLDQYRSRG